MKSKAIRKRKSRSVRNRVSMLSAQNRRLLTFIRKLRTEPDDMGDAWWDEFRDFLRKHPVRLGKSSGD